MPTYSCEQVGHLRHALGLDDFVKKPWRNHFAAEPGSDNDALWAVLVEAGLAFKRPDYPAPGFPDNCYVVTEAGIQVARREAQHAQ